MALKRLLGYFVTVRCWREIGEGPVEACEIITVAAAEIARQKWSLSIYVYVGDSANSCDLRTGEAARCRPVFLRTSAWWHLKLRARANAAAALASRPGENLRALGMAA